MAIVTLEDLFACARRQGFAIAAAEVRDLNFLQGALAAAEGTQAPMLFAVPAGGMAQGRCADLLAAVEHAAQRATVPVVVHGTGLDTLEAAVHAINRGCNSLGLSADLTRNESACRRVVAVARDCGVPVLGRVGVADSVAVAGIVERTGLHGLELHWPSGSRPGEEEWLAWMQEDGAPPVLIHAYDLSQVSQWSVLRDCGAAVYLTGRRVLQEGLTEAEADYDLLMENLTERLVTAADELIENCGSGGRGRAVLAQCRAWCPVEHLIIYNVSGIDETQAEAMMRDGHRILGGVPGVRRVFTGVAVKDGARYRYCWLVRFVHPKVIDSYRDHPDHVAFADGRFRPVAGDRISIDYLALAD